MEINHGRMPHNHPLDGEPNPLDTRVTVEALEQQMEELQEQLAANHRVNLNHALIVDSLPSEEILSEIRHMQVEPQVLIGDAHFGQVVTVGMPPLDEVILERARRMGEGLNLNTDPPANVIWTNGDPVIGAPPIKKKVLKRYRGSDYRGGHPGWNDRSLIKWSPGEGCFTSPMKLTKEELEGLEWFMSHVPVGHGHMPVIQEEPLHAIWFADGRLFDATIEWCDRESGQYVELDSLRIADLLDIGN